MDEIIQRVITNLKNWNCWDVYDFRLNEEEGKAVRKALSAYLNMMKARDNECQKSNTDQDG